MRKVGSGAGEFVQEVILTSANSFTKTINDLDAEDTNGNAYTYYVANESGAPEYIDGVQSGYETTYSGTTVTNTWKEATIPAPKTDITVNKVWAGEPSSQST